MGKHTTESWSWVFPFPQVCLAFIIPEGLVLSPEGRPYNRMLWHIWLSLLFSLSLLEAWGDFSFIFTVRRNLFKFLEVNLRILWETAMTDFPWVFSFRDSFILSLQCVINYSSFFSKLALDLQRVPVVTLCFSKSCLPVFSCLSSEVVGCPSSLHISWMQKELLIFQSVLISICQIRVVTSELFTCKTGNQIDPKQATYCSQN